MQAQLYTHTNNTIAHSLAHLVVRSERPAYLRSTWQRRNYGNYRIQ